MPYLSVNGLRLRYEAWGQGGRHLLLLHGLGSTADDWLLQQAAFGARYQCLAVDLRGHGLSDKPPGPYSVALFAADVRALLAALAMPPAHVLGLSLGGLVAQQLALSYPHAVASLVLINTFASLWPPSPVLLRQSWYRLPALLRRPSMASTATQVARRLFPGPERAALRAEAAARLAANDPVAYREALRAVLRFRPGRRLQRIDCPVLVMAGDRDAVVPLAYKQRLCRLLPQARFALIAGAGHASNIDQPEAVNQAVLAFLGEVDLLHPLRV